MRNIFKFACAALVSVSLMTSCIEEVEPTGSVNDNQISQSLSAQEALVNGIAGYMNYYDSSWAGGYHCAWAYGSIGMIRDLLCSDLAPNASSYWVWYQSWFTNTGIGENYVWPQWVWTYLCRLTFTINSVIDQLEPNSEQSTYYLGIAHAYRAMVRMEMGQMYEFKANPYTQKPEVEGLTIPDMRDGMTEDETRQNPRITKEALLEDIKADLALAIEYLDGYVPTQVSFPSQAVAYGLKARMHLWEEDYTAAKEAAQTAIALSGCTPLTEAQWTDTKTGFNSYDSNNSWMWATRLTDESNLVKTGILNFTSWMASETAYGYAGGGGAYALCDAQLYKQISDNDFRKKSWRAPEGAKVQAPMLGATTAGYNPDNIPELAVVKFRPGAGDPDDYLVGSATDYPLMRVEEMHLIVAECDAHNGDASALTSFMTSYRNPYYQCYASTPEEMVQEVMLQKRIELWGEGRIFFDYKRLALPINRYYEGTNHRADAAFNVADGVAPWLNFCVVRTEAQNNSAFVNNPDPSDTVALYDEDGIK